MTRCVVCDAVDGVMAHTCLVRSSLYQTDVWSYVSFALRALQNQQRMARRAHHIRYCTATSHRWLRDCQSGLCSQLLVLGFLCCPLCKKEMGHPALTTALSRFVTLKQLVVAKSLEVRSCSCSLF
jgi:hypothetical protein